MKVVQKIVAASVCWTSLVIMLESYQRLRRELTLLEGDLLKECQLVSVLVTDELSALWAVQGKAAVDARIHALNPALTPITLRVVDFSAPVASPLHPRFERDALKQARERGEALRDERDTDHDALVTYTWLPTVHEHAALEISVSLRQEEQFVERALFDLALMLLLIILIAVVFSTWAGWFVIGKRITSMIQVTRDAASGTHRHMEVSSFKDEISELMQELNAMNAALEQSTTHVLEERARREALTAQLLHTDRLATTGVLLSQVAHEIGTPLAVIRGRLQRAKKHVDAGHIVQRELLIATEQVDRIKHIIREMLDFSRGHADHSTCPMEKVIAHAIELVEMLATRYQVSFALRVTHHGLFHGDRLAMEQALINVLINALHASKKGDVITVTLSQELDEFSRPTTSIAICDQGTGIDAALGAKIFEPFFTTKPSGQGTGMGLMIASTIARAHQGSLRLDEAYTKGARFVFELPDAAALESEE